MTMDSGCFELLEHCVTVYFFKSTGLINLIVGIMYAVKKQ